MAKRDQDEFYVGYLPKAPPGVAALLKKNIIAILVITPLIGFLLVMAQGPFAASFFEFGVTRQFEGVLVEKPYPSIRIDRPDANSGVATGSRYYLVAFGKHGAANAVAGLDGKRVKLEGSLIYRENQTMLELKQGSIEVLGEATETIQDASLGMATLTGEIVDSKCFLGVMNPGNLKPHKACAVRCISGGIPPILLVRDQAGRARHFLLVSEKGEAVNQAVLGMIAEPVEITGRLARSDDLMILYADPATYRRLSIP